MTRCSETLSLLFHIFVSSASYILPPLFIVYSASLGRTQLFPASHQSSGYALTYKSCRWESTPRWCLLSMKGCDSHPIVAFIRSTWLLHNLAKTVMHWHVSSALCSLILGIYKVQAGSEYRCCGEKLRSGWGSLLGLIFTNKSSER